MADCGSLGRCVVGSAGSLVVIPSAPLAQDLILILRHPTLFVLLQILKERLHLKKEK